MLTKWLNGLIRGESISPGGGLQQLRPASDHYNFYSADILINSFFQVNLFPNQAISEGSRKTRITLRLHLKAEKENIRSTFICILLKLKKLAIPAPNYERETID